VVTPVGKLIMPVTLVAVPAVGTTIDIPELGTSVQVLNTDATGRIG
jgi:hypothetical protein